jgi:divalent metal cation (Fe/Co/Zn/Cd) transporter
LTLFVLIAVVGVKEGLYRVAQRVGTRLDSLALRADAWDHRSDALTSAAAAIGISVSVFGGPSRSASLG